MEIFKIILLVMLILCAICASASKRLLVSVIIYMSYSLIMSVVWITLESPDLAITEAAVGAGVSTVLFLLTLRIVNRSSGEDENESEEGGDGK